ncbi:acyl carrier protein [Streptomyces sp. 900105755]
MTIEERVKKTLVDALGIDEEINNRMLLSYFESDELDNTQLQMALMEEFDIAVPEEDAKQWVTVQDVIDYIEESQR